MRSCFTPDGVLAGTGSAGAGATWSGSAGAGAASCAAVGADGFGPGFVLQLPGGRPGFGGGGVRNLVMSKPLFFASSSFHTCGGGIEWTLAICHTGARAHTGILPERSWKTIQPVT